MFYCIHPLTITLAMLRRYPLVLRSLAILANGQRSIGEMARILDREPGTIGVLLVVLHEQGIVRRYNLPAEVFPSHAAPGYAATHHYGSTQRGRQTRKLQPEVSYGRYSDTRAAAGVR